MAVKFEIICLVCSLLCASLDLRVTFEKVIRVEKHYIVFDEERVRWSRAFEECKRRGLELVTLESREEHEFLAGLIRLSTLPSSLGRTAEETPYQPQKTPSDFWTSGQLDTDGYWRWASDRRLLNFTEWAPGQPHVAGGGRAPDACLRLSGAQRLQWYASDCAARHGFVCQTRSGPGVAGFNAGRVQLDSELRWSTAAPGHDTALLPASWHESRTRPTGSGRRRLSESGLRWSTVAPGHDTAWLPHAGAHFPLVMPASWHESRTRPTGSGRRRLSGGGESSPSFSGHEDTANWLAGLEERRGSVLQRRPPEHSFVPDEKLWERRKDQSPENPLKRLPDQPQQSVPEEKLLERWQEQSPEKLPERLPDRPEYILALSDRVYTFHTQANVSWDEATWSCRLRDARLASVSDWRGSLRISEFLSLQGLDKMEFWLDGRLIRTPPRDFRGVRNRWIWWSSGRPIGPAFNWAPGRPKFSFHDEERCLVLSSGRNDWQWTNDVCSRCRPYACERPGPVPTDSGSGTAGKPT